ncbi:MAG: lactate racemase domain-containing protein [Promethearchaeota archaeon]
MKEFTQLIHTKEYENLPSEQKKEVISLNYGKKMIQLKIPKKNFNGLIEPTEVKPVNSDNIDMLNYALDHPTNCDLIDLIKDKKVCILLEDGTRKSHPELIIDVCTNRLQAAKKILYVITTGSHDPISEENEKINNAIMAAIKKYSIPNAEILVHDCFNHEYIDVGTTSFGNKILMNKFAHNYDVYFVISDMKTHYFAGYSNPIKNFLPGICAYETIEKNHALALDDNSTFCRHPLHPDENKKQQPLAEDMLEAVYLMTSNAKIFVLGLVTLKDKIIWCEAGDLSTVTTHGIEKVNQIGSFVLDKKADFIIVSAGGYPYDGSLYDSQRALELTKNALKEGGEILFLAECGIADGIAPNEQAKKFFYDELAKPIDEVLKGIEKEYKLYTHKAYKFAKLLKKSKIWVKSSLNKEILENIHLNPIEDPQFIINNWINQNPNAKITAFNHGSKLAIYVNET